MKARYLIPLVLFFILIGFLVVGLNRDPHEVPSPLINKPAPLFTLPRLEQPDQTFSSTDFKGKVWILNAWASWCVACREEHPLLVEFSRTHRVPLVGLDYKDQRKDGMNYLRQHGNPYDLTVQDVDGRVGIDFGVYGVPETYLIDKNGVIRHKQIGPITPEALEKTILPLIEKLEKS